MKKSVEIIRNINGIFLFLQDNSLKKQIKALSDIIATFQHSKITEYSETKYSESEKKEILEKAEYNHKNLLNINQN